jgi:hypothetical protein
LSRVPFGNERKALLGGPNTVSVPGSFKSSTRFAAVRAWTNIEKSELPKAISKIVWLDVGTGVGFKEVGADVGLNVVGNSVILEIGFVVVGLNVGTVVLDDVGAAVNRPGNKRTLSITCMIPLQASIFGIMILASFTNTPVAVTSITTVSSYRVIKSPLMKSFL